MRRKLSVKIPIKLTDAQKRVDASKARFKIIKAGRRFGKTRYGCYWLAKRGMTVPGIHWYVVRSLDLIRDEVWPVLCQMVPSEFVVHRDDRLFRLTLRVGGIESIIVGKSCEREDSLRGRGIASLVIDEASFVRSSLFDMVLRPTLADKMAPALIFSSPKRGWFTKQYDFAVSGADSEWEGFHFTIFDSWLYTMCPGGKEEVEKIKRSTPENVWLQEYMAMEGANSGIVYDEFNDKSIFRPGQRFESYKSWPVVAGIDWGMKDSTGVVWIAISPQGYPVAVREHVKGNIDVERHAIAIRSVEKDMKVKDFDRVLDRSAFRRVGDTSVSIADLFSKQGIKCARSEKDYSPQVDIAKRFLRGDGATPWAYFSTDCPELIKAFKSYEHDEHEPDALAAWRYALTLIVKRRMTPLASHLKYVRFDHSAEKVSAPSRDFRIDPSRFRSPAKQWRWDTEVGAPY